MIVLVILVVVAMILIMLVVLITILEQFQVRLTANMDSPKKWLAGGVGECDGQESAVSKNAAGSWWCAPASTANFVQVVPVCSKTAEPSTDATWGRAWRSRKKLKPCQETCTRCGLKNAP